MEPNPEWKPQLIDLHHIEDAFSFEEGFSRPNWRVISKAIQEKVADPFDLNPAWDEAVRQWLAQLQSELGGDYRIAESGRFFLLSELATETNERILDFSERTRSQIRERLQRAAWNPSHGKHVILLFTEEDDYYQYVSYFHRDGTHPASGGCLIHKDYVHIAAPYEPSSVRQTLAHELLHNCVVHLRLPLWLNEGLAQVFQHSVSTTTRPILDEELRQRHFGFWNAENIQGFWAGTSFRKPGDSNQLSYSLAEIILHLLGDRQGDWGDFLKQADWRDAGQTAALDCLKTDLGDVMSTFLGDGDWRPRRKAMADLWEASKKDATGQA